MPRKPPLLQKLMNTDVSLFLMAAVLVLCVTGSFFGVWVALKTLGYIFAGLFVIGMPLLLMHADQTETGQLEDLQHTYGGELRRHLIPVRGSRSLTFEHGDAVARLSTHHRRSEGDYRSWVELRVDWPDRRLRLDITAENIIARAGQFFGMQDISLGRAGFDDRYAVRGNNEDVIRELLSRPVQRAILAMPDQKIFGIRIHRGTWRSRAGYYSLTTDLQPFVEASLQVYDAMRTEDRP
ncbi:hypothetical protein Mal4_11050 [Maioricimonas rarisocia]|uniref:DUF3137 domain-containing protein n=1 Tax=Maioricimonas rarisocia TaxID=2528026 RepID=A0A517Z311_9PLAN|nr:hypothetical protein [Maioricimonas rarisocia]QDU36807.1 hypothetical protein Mal4_11050 [Maioricimonas rarisocia]